MRGSRLPTFASIDEERGRAGDVDGLAERDRSVDVRLGLRLQGAGGDVGALDAGAVGEGGQFFIGIFGSDVGLGFVGLGDKLPERVI